VYKVNIDTHATEQICKEEFPVLDTEEIQDEIWVSTTCSDLRSYSSMQEQRKIVGRARIVRYEVSDNKKFVVVKDDQESVQVLSVLENKVEKVDLGFKEAVGRVSMGKITNSWFSANLKLGCICLEFTAGECANGFEIMNNKQVFFIEQLFKELFYPLLDPENTDRTSAFEHVWLMLKQHLAEKVEVFWMTQTKDLSKNRINEIPVWIKEIVPEINKALSSSN